VPGLWDEVPPDAIRSHRSDFDAWVGSVEAGYSIKDGVKVAQPLVLDQTSLRKLVILIRFEIHLTTRSPVSNP